MRTACWSWLFVLTLTATIAGAAEPPQSEAPKFELPKFELHDGDRVVFLGNTLIEREQKYGYWELMLTMAWPERNVTFRNLGWSGDTVWGESRAGFGTQADGFKALVNQVNAAKPTVIFVGYGNVEAFDGEAGLPKFIDGYNKLLDELEKAKARIAVLGPIAQMETSSPNPEAKRYNDSVRSYSDAIAKVALARKHLFFPIDIRHVVAQWDLKETLTTNGMDWNELGYSAGCCVLELNLSKHRPQVYVSSEQIPNVSRAALEATQRQTDLAKALRQRIVHKNELFFHRWRPQNETYLFGFRKHEQGKNAEEVFAFDPLIEAEEKKIAELRVRLAAEMKEANDAK